MEMFQNLLEVGSQLSSVQEFYEFTEDIHKMIGCDKPECDISNFLTPMKDIIHDPNEDYDFSMMFQLKNKETEKQVKNLIEGFN